MIIILTLILVYGHIGIQNDTYYKLRCEYWFEPDRFLVCVFQGSREGRLFLKSFIKTYDFLT